MINRSTTKSTESEKYKPKFNIGYKLNSKNDNEAINFQGFQLPSQQGIYSTRSLFSDSESHDSLSLSKDGAMSVDVHTIGNRHRSMKQWQKEKSKKALFQATRHGHHKKVEHLVRNGISVNSEDNFGNTILLIASQNGSKRLVKIALRYGANIDHQNVCQ